MSEAKPSVKSVTPPNASTIQGDTTKKTIVRGQNQYLTNSVVTMTAEPIQQVMPGFESPSDDILKLLKQHHIRYIDKRVTISGRDSDEVIQQFGASLI